MQRGSSALAISAKVPPTGRRFPRPASPDTPDHDGGPTVYVPTGPDIQDRTPCGVKKSQPPADTRGDPAREKAAF
jgi:hypothetical protein